MKPIINVYIFGLQLIKTITLATLYTLTLPQKLTTRCHYNFMLIEYRKIVNILLNHGHLNSKFEKSFICTNLLM